MSIASTSARRLGPPGQHLPRRWRAACAVALALVSLPAVEGALSFAGALPAAASSSYYTRNRSSCSRMPEAPSRWASMPEATSTSSTAGPVHE
ncbi:MAG TPA: hypothetical protein VMD59_15215 [Acidimicrobiales bacterium]|nr:hypothetical protein [Acidimicrobiales bacterium]